MTIINKLLAAAALACGSLAAGQAAAEFPERAITMIVPFAAGGGTDVLARTISTKLGQALGQTIVVENKPGAGSLVGTGVTAQSKPDGYTMLFTTSNLVVNESLYKDRPYKLSDLEPITIVARSPNVLLANPSFPAKDLQQTIDYLKAHPGEVKYGSSGVGGSGHLAMEMLKFMTKTDAVHVAYKSGGPALTAVLSDEVPLLFNNIFASLSPIRSGQVVAIGVTGAQRSPELPDVPTLAESGLPGFDVTAWFGFLAPAGTPQDIVDRYAKELRTVLADPEVKKQIAAQGGDIVGNTPAEFKSIMEADVGKYAEIINAAHIEPN